ncbi:MAG: hypothetical protein LUE86_02650, partial [Clostridiales bacterium]|nr:hypothetical protein [Clostridiales bacterium]
MKRGLERILRTGVLAAVLTVGAFLPVFSENAPVTPGKAPVARFLSCHGAMGRLTAYAEEVTVGAAPGEAVSGTAGNGETAVADGTDEASGSGTVTAGSGTVTAGSGSVTVGSSGGSATITAGAGMTTSYGPGGPGVTTSGVSDGTEGFAGKVENPIVTVAEKYTFSQMEQDIRELQARYGSLLQVNVIGTSLDGRSIYEIVLGNADASKHVLIHAGIHAREYMTPLLVMKQLEYGLYFYQTGSYQGQPLSDLLNKVAIHIVPMVNPDGISISQSGLGAVRSAELQSAIRQCYEYDLSAARTTAAFEDYLNYWKAN